MNEIDFINGIIIGALIIGIIFGFIIYKLNQNILSVSTLNDICTNLTNKTSINGSVKDGKLICTMPSYDHTNNIIIKYNNEEKWL